MIKSLLSFILTLFKSRTQLQLENLFLRKQLEIYSRSNKRSVMKQSDRDCKFGKYFGRKISDIGIKEIVTAYRSPWQNGYV